MSILRYENVEWTLPLLGWADGYLLSLMDVFKKFEEPVVINAVASYVCGFAQGGFRTKVIENRKNLEKILSAAVNLDIIPRLDFSNPFYNEKNKVDEISSYLVDLGYDFGASFLVSVDTILNKLKAERYGINCVASQNIAVLKFQNPSIGETYCVDKEIEFYNELSEKYETVIVRPEFSKNYLLDHIEKFNDISKIEIIVNSSCYQDCPLIIEHMIAKQSALGDASSLYGNNRCYCDEESISLKDRFRNSNVHEIELVDKLVDAGIRKINLSGGVNDLLSISDLSSILLYMIKSQKDAQMLIATIEKASYDLSESLNKLIY